MVITSVKFSNYKALKSYSVSLQPMNILVGPNNCGKSTVISAFRALEYCLRIAKSKKATRVVTAEGYTVNGHSIVVNNLPISVENIHTNYEYETANCKIEFRLGSKKSLTLFFDSEGRCAFYWDADGKPANTPGVFRKQFPINIQVIPILGPIEQKEILVTDETVRRESGTLRASRHFRNYWYKNPDGFKAFKQLVEKTWPETSIILPELTDYLERRLVMFCSEKRIDRELFWAGFGFQIWCQLLTHISRCSDSDLLVIDEPEVYLHPDVQRQLLSILRDIQPNILLATHSTEIMGDADPSEILLIDKSKQSAKRLHDVESVQKALISLGSIQNLTLTQLARTKKMLFVEGMDDYKILRRFAKLAGFYELATGSGLTPIESGGYSSWSRIESLPWGLQSTLGAEIKLGAVYDHDYWPTEEILEIEKKLTSKLIMAHIHERKEIENYLLVPTVLNRALEKSITSREKYTGTQIDRSCSIDQLLDELTEKMKTTVQGQYVAKYLNFNKRSKKDKATLSTEIIKRFEEKWTSLATRMEIVPGKKVLSALRTRLHEKCSVSLTDIKIIDEFQPEEIPNDLMCLLGKLDSFRKLKG